MNATTIESVQGEISETMRGLQVLGQSILRQRAARAARPSFDVLLERAERRVRNSEVTLKANLSQADRRDEEEELRQAREAVVELNGGNREDEQLSHDVDSFHSSLADLQALGEQWVELAKPSLAGQVEGQQCFNAAIQFLLDLGAANGSYRCPDPESAEACNTREARFSLLLSRLASFTGDEWTYRQQNLLPDAANLEVSAYGLSNLELGRRIEDKRRYLEAR